MPPETSQLSLTLLSLTLLFIFSSATIRLGSTLYASNLNASWSSPNGTFSVSFIQDGPSAYFAAISYAGGVPVWKASQRAVDSSGSFHLLSSGTLRLVNGSGATVWDSSTENRNVSSASIDDSGNLVLLGNNSVSVWSSFDNPSDTIVPSQNFTTRKVLESGKYSFTLLQSGNLTLKWNNSIIYWNNSLNSSIESNLTSPVLRLQSIGILSIVDPTLPSAVIVAYSSDYAEGSDILRFLRLDTDGNLRIYSSARGSGTTTKRWAAVTDQCQVFGYCGNMGICSYNDTGSDPVCGCPSQNFELVDANDSKQGCKRKVEIEDCPGSATMLELPHTKFLTFAPELTSQVFFVGISACRLNCLVTGSCVASTSLSDGTGLCYLKTPDFVSGFENPALPSTSYVKVCGPVLPNPSSNMQVLDDRKSWRLRAWIVVVVVVATLLVLVALEGGLWYWCCRNSPKFGGLSAQYALLEYASGAPVQFSYKELERSTKGFKEKLGAGVSGRRNFEVSPETNRKKFSLWAYEEFEKGNVKGIVDKRLAEDVDIEQVMRAIQEGIMEIERPPAPKAFTEGSVSGPSMNMSSNFSAVSTFAASASASAPAPSSSSSLQIGVSPLPSDRNLERTSSSLLRPSNPN
ncbi:hypothetical protein Patl1_07874 [Pistacia atlantica]|uniref:Uncharacterized protein n=1 Tax=Pistacia atlantica TaxID=434234 RepID=A0ACC1AHM0_9ROSI|nr:hypothetical protein Patl1_07874 [Pistacia atlantica]